MFIGRKDQCWSWSSNTLVTWWEKLTGKNTWWGQSEGRRRKDNRVWDGWMASSTNGHEFEQTLGDSEGHGDLACYSPWGHKNWALLSNWRTKNPTVKVVSLLREEMDYMPIEFQKLLTSTTAIRKIFLRVGLEGVDQSDGVEYKGD